MCEFWRKLWISYISVDLCYGERRGSLYINLKKRVDFEKIERCERLFLNRVKIKKWSLVFLRKWQPHVQPSCAMFLMSIMWICRSLFFDCRTPHTIILLTRLSITSELRAPQQDFLSILYTQVLVRCRQSQHRFPCANSVRVVVCVERGDVRSWVRHGIYLVSGRLIIVGICEFE